ncbi:helix-hairpin-helix domain-containing protein [Streptomyces sp. NBC_01497]|uniref:helix-hairpin-helix domain-containing protein n=1 Tax=Streptomyces sp. NBC_01497 TaxID=2903885 RepID=UPI002E33394D|nr:helix-hairpin-helix domain-containing protein [Streptomyces sp. NBC_01497]
MADEAVETAGTGEPGEASGQTPGETSGQTPGETSGQTPDSASPKTPAAGGTAEAGDASGKAEGDEAAAAGEASGTGDAAEKAAELSEAQAELAAQRELRRRIDQRKADKAGPVAAGAKLSGHAADLLAAVRAVESGGTPDPVVLRAAPAPVPAQSPAGAAPRPAPLSGGAPPPEALAAVRGVLGEGGAPESLAGPVAGALGEHAGEVLRQDPWQLLAVPGVRPEQADGFARALLGAECGPGDERRAVALVVWLLERAAVQGHTALEASAVRAGLAGQGVPDPDGAVRHAVAEGAVLVFREEEEGAGEYGEDGEDEEPGAGAEPDAEDGTAPDERDTAADAPVLLGLDRFALAEESLADGLARVVKTVAELPRGPWTEAERAAPSPSAAELLRAVAEHGLVLHTGGEAARAEPVALAAAARALGLRTALAVHSENGRDRLGAPGAADGSRGADVVTVAGLLAGAEGPGRDADGMFALDLLVVLDAPQLDVETAAMLVESLADGGRLVLGGDPGVLGSAGAGRVFGDLLAARICPQIASRTPDAGPIGELVSGIGVGELNQVPAPDKEIVIVPVRDAGEAVHRTVQLVAESVPRAFGLAAGQTQVVTVGHGGAAGTRALNTALKQRLAPGPGRFGGFDPGDRVAYVPSPGRTVQGVVVSAEEDGLRVRLDGSGTSDRSGTSGSGESTGGGAGGVTVTVARERVDIELRHGWALTAHQAAGMRWPAAVVVLPGDAAGALTRTWVYTAFGRGERHLSVVHGVDQALPKAVAEGERPSAGRCTRLRALLEGLLAPDPEPAP